MLRDFCYNIREVNIVRNKVVVIISHYLYRLTQEALSRLQLDCDVILVTYDNFEQIAQVYDRYAEEADGFLVSGQIAAAAIQMAPHRMLKPILPFQADTAALYKELLLLFLERRDQDTTRVALDFLLPVSGGYTARDFLARPEIESVSADIWSWIRRTGLREIDGVESSIINTLVSLWEQDEIDMVICQYSSIIPALEAHGIPYRFPFLSDYQLGELFRSLEAKIELEKLRANLPALINIAPRHASQMTDERRQALEKWIRQYFKDHLIECVMQENPVYFSTITTIQAVRYFTQNFTVCGLSGYLREKLDFEVAIGYGIGSNVNQALNNARSAVREAIFTGHSFLRDENGNLIGPLGSDRRMFIETQPDRDVGEIAKRCQLSTMTIQKVMTNMKMSGTNKITSQELSERFGVTVRNANRILSSLAEGGFAEIIYSQTTNSKGRPVKVYELDFSIRPGGQATS